MGSNINWIDERSPFKKEKNYIDSSNTTNGWKTISNRDNFINCNACTKRIKVNQKMLWLTFLYFLLVSLQTVAF